MWNHADNGLDMKMIRISRYPDIQMSRIFGCCPGRQAGRRTSWKGTSGSWAPCRRSCSWDGQKRGTLIIYEMSVMSIANDLVDCFSLLAESLCSLSFDSRLRSEREWQRLNGAPLLCRSGATQLHSLSFCWKRRQRAKAEKWKRLKSRPLRRLWNPAFSNCDENPLASRFSS